MKLKRFLCALLCALALSNASPAAQAAGLRAAVASGKVTLNGQIIDNSTAQYPLLVYRDITYFPMTYHLCRFLGLTTEWDSPSRTLTITRTGGAGDYVPDTGHGRKSGSVSVTRVDYPVVVNDETVDNSRAQWPLLNYSGVTYFPLTWAFAVDAFGWDYHWDAASGLEIGSTGAAPYVTAPIVNPANPPLSTGERSEGEIINGASRAWASAAWGSSPENLTVDTADWSLEGIKKAIAAALAEHVKGTLLEGRLTEVEIPYTFQYPAGVKSGDVLKVPYTASYHGDERVLPSGKTFTPTSTAEEVAASVRLTGPGFSTGVDSAFRTGQETYRKLEACAALGTVELSGDAADVAETVQAALEARLAAAGLTKQYRIQSLSLGSYTQPGGMAAGESQTINFQVSFSPLEGEGEDFSLPGQAVLKVR